ncbi:MAG: 30S ribosomal protein S17 [Frankiaceae bacterium]|jgi:small subunit ribosomal protein S17|nr:30S ribosomal protein S17 [Frankiaceae bacterium]
MADTDVSAPETAAPPASSAEPAPAAPPASSAEPAPAAPPAPAGARNSFRKTREGLVVSDKMDKTVVVAVEDRVKHPLYGKVLRRTSKLKAHDESNEAGVGDRVLLMETRPQSATKRWRLVEILEKAK